jgi:signal transduction histidine kinase
MDSEPDIPLARVAAFLRQHTHDLRNGLNSLDLETAYLEEFVNEDEGRACLQRVRSQLRSLAEQLRSLSGHFQKPQPIAAPIAARELLLIWQEKHAALENAPEVHWEDELGDEKVTIDVEMIAAVFRELLRNAAVFSKGAQLTVAARAEGENVIFELREPKKAKVDPSTWGTPLSTTRDNSYGLGLWAARRFMEANRGKLTQRYLPKEEMLNTQVIFPAS